MHRRLLPFLVCHQYAFISLELCFGFPQLPSHLVIPLFDAIKDTCIFIIFVLSDLFLSLPDLLFLELCELTEAPSQLLDLVVGLRSVLFVDAVAVRAIVGQSHDFNDDLFECLLEEAVGDAPLRTLDRGLCWLSDRPLILVSNDFSRRFLCAHTTSWWMLLLFLLFWLCNFRFDL